MADAPEQLTNSARVKRLTSAYEQREDRLLFSGETGAGAVESFLLTRRLSLRLLEHLLGILDGKLTQQGGQQDSTQTAALMQEMAQTRAQARLQPGEPVAAAEESTPAWLVHSVDVTRLPAGVRLEFSDESGRKLQTRLTAEELRQWLGILYRLWRKAEWGEEIWPQWMRESDEPARPPGKAVH